MNDEKIGKTVKIKKDVFSQYEGKQGEIIRLNNSDKYDYDVLFPNGDCLAYAEDELMFPRSTK